MDNTLLIFGITVCFIIMSILLINNVALRRDLIKRVREDLPEIIMEIYNKEGISESYVDMIQELFSDIISEDKLDEMFYDY